MIYITVDKNDLLEYLKDGYEKEHKAFMQLSEREQNDLIDHLVYLCYKELDEGYYFNELLERLKK